MDSERRITFLKAQVVGLSAYKKTLPAHSPARKKLAEELEKYTRELDQWLNLSPPTTPPLRSDEKSPLVAQLLEQITRTLDVSPPEAEHRFHPTRRWRLDLAWPAFRVGVEVHGGIWSGGRHTRGGGFEKDREKVNEAALLGWIVLEVTGGQIRSGQAVAWVQRALKEREPTKTVGGEEG